MGGRSMCWQQCSPLSGHSGWEESWWTGCLGTRDWMGGASLGGRCWWGLEHVIDKDRQRVGLAQPGEGKPQVGPCYLQSPNQRGWKSEPDSP